MKNQGYTYPLHAKFLHMGIAVFGIIAFLTGEGAGGDKPVEYLKVEMKGVMVTSINVGGSAASEDRLTENVSLNFAKVFYQYTLQDRKGAAGPKIDYKFDVQANKKG